MESDKLFIILYAFVNLHCTSLPFICSFIFSGMESSITMFISLDSYIQALHQTLTIQFSYAININGKILCVESLGPQSQGSIPEFLALGFCSVALGLLGVPFSPHARCLCSHSLATDLCYRHRLLQDFLNHSLHITCTLSNYKTLQNIIAHLTHAPCPSYFPFLLLWVYFPVFQMSL